MSFRVQPPTRRLACVSGVLLAGLLLSTHGLAKEEPVRKLMEFAAEMARHGNWREARYRWEAAARDAPDNPRIHNNLAVVHEVLGELGPAGEAYERALSLSPWDKSIVDNHRRFQRFRRQVADPDEAEAEGPEVVYEAAPSSDKKSKNKGKPFKASVLLPVPARMDVSGDHTLLVVSFLADENRFFDLNREMVRFLRGEFRKRSGLEQIGISPPPAIPEQRLEDLIANHEFWQHIGREYGADLIVSGRVQYDRRDSSGFRDVDYVSPSTGQKIRQSQFVEQEKFLYDVDIIFMDGGTGELRYRDRLSRTTVFQGSQNDPITAFFELSESLAPDVLAIVKARFREDVRYIFKR